VANSAYNFKLGDFECIVVSDGTITVPGPQSLNHTQNAAPARHAMDVQCLFVNTGVLKILVDTGCGSGFQPTAGKLLQNLKVEGVNRADVDMIIFTHGHGDHLGGSLDLSGRPVFPAARNIVSKKEWDCWVSGQGITQKLPMFALARKNLLPIADRFEKVEDNTEVLPGVKIMVAPGHSPGNSLLELSSRGEKLLCIGDLAHSPQEFTVPAYYSHFDASPEQAISARKKILSDIAKSGIMVFACHFPFPGLGYVVLSGGTLVWRPLETGA
jgi:glyoxylase-like metal-dependent hydrolase (beta-lactamase superfamily II)